MKVEIADIFRLYGDAYRAKFGDSLLPSHRRALRDLQACRTPELGGQLYLCQQCDEALYSYHSCQNRHCPKCQNHQANDWLQQQLGGLLPVPYFLLTFTLPKELRELARANQKAVYNILFRASAASLQQLAWDERFVGGQVAMVGVLHTWTRDLRYHPHVHYMVSGGGLDDDGRWRSSRPDFLVPVQALSIIFRAKVRDELKKADLFAKVEEHVWHKAWVVHCEAVGNGAAAFKYLAPYIFRVAISNKRILKLEDGKVTFAYKDSASQQMKSATVSAEEFIRRFLQHVLPKRFIKVRYYGLLSPSNRQLLKLARTQLGVAEVETQTSNNDAAALNNNDAAALDDNEAATAEPPETLRCPKCGSRLIVVEKLPRQAPQPNSREPP